MKQEEALRGSESPGPKVYTATLARVVEHTPEARSLFFGLPSGCGLNWQPGQFISIAIEGGDEGAARPYSIASDPGGGFVEICLNRVPGGVASSGLFRLEPGAMIRFTGPWGRFLLDRTSVPERVFIAQGTGIAPVRPLIRAALADTAVGLRLIHAAAREPELLYREEMEALARQRPGFQCEYLVEGKGGSESHAPLRERIMRRYVERDADRNRQFYICGVGGIVIELRDLLRGAGYERRAVHYERW